MTTNNAQPASPVVPDVKAPAVSSGTPAEVKPTEAPVTPPAPQYLTKEDAQKLLEEAVKQAKDAGRREMQSEKDRDVRDAIRAKQQAERELANVNAGFNELDEDARTKMELARYRARDRSQQQYEAEEQQRRQLEATLSQFKTNLTEYATEVGIDPSTTGLDWGEDTESLTVRQNKFLKSVAKIQKEQKKMADDALKNTIKEEIMKTRKELGLDSVDNTAPVTGGDHRIFTEEEIADYDFYKTNKEAIKKAQKEGRIKVKT